MQHPSVYVGKVAHGHYDTRCDGSGLWPDPHFCTGVCGYWEDFRWVGHPDIAPDVLLLPSGMIMRTLGGCPTTLDMCQR